MSPLDNLHTFPQAPASEAETTDPNTRRTRTMTAAALAANRANAKKSTGPRTTLGKARSASNSFVHGLYSLDLYNHFLPDPNDAIIVTTNYMEQFAPVTPLEHSLVQKLVSLELRFLTVETLYGNCFDHVYADQFPGSLPFVLRELDRIPKSMLRLVKELKQLIKEREATCDLEPVPIEDFPPLAVVPFEESPDYRDPQISLAPPKKSGTNPNPPRIQPSIENIYAKATTRYGVAKPPESPASPKSDETKPNLG